MPLACMVAIVVREKVTTRYFVFKVDTLSKKNCPAFKLKINLFNKIKLKYFFHKTIISKKVESQISQKLDIAEKPKIRQKQT